MVTLAWDDCFSWITGHWRVIRKWPNSEIIFLQWRFPGLNVANERRPNPSNFLQFLYFPKLSETQYGFKGEFAPGDMMINFKLTM